MKWGMSIVFSGLLSGVAPPPVTLAQISRPWTFGECLQQAMKNNLGVRQAEINSQVRELDLLQARTAYLPDLSASGFGGLTFGQRLDPFNLRFVNQRTEMVSLGLNANLLLFGGFQNLHRLKQARYALESAAAQAEKVKQDLTLNVASLFLQLIFAEERRERAVLQYQSTQATLERVRDLVEAGARPRGDLLNMEAQLASEAAVVIQAENTLRMARLNLAQLLMMDSISVQRPELSPEKAGLEILKKMPDVLYAEALSSNPAVRAAEWNLKASLSQLSIAKGAFFPTLSFSASLGSGYSSLTQRITDTLITVIPQDPVRYYTYGGDSLDIPKAPIVLWEFQRAITPFGSQLRQNFNNQVGLFLSVPILNGLNNHANLRRARLNVRNSELQLEQQKQQLRNTIFSAYNDGLAALSSWEATRKALKAAHEALDYAETALEAGSLPSAEFVQIKNRYLQSETDEVVARYELIFRLVILHYLTNKPIPLN
ncbi:MAG: TolC family protein [Flavobacteriales bacterium]|nr:TolC family protein [Flavobacteriales bacterium]MCX7767440.1 TolC family protein [Flavobacteriales bacterium]MDW8410046.1 TolC family protein [Flavobacteriales bacterium]